MSISSKATVLVEELKLPSHTDIYYGGKWQKPVSGLREDTTSPSTGEVLASVAVGGAEDIELAIQAASEAYKSWRKVPPMERARLMRKIAERLREHAVELATIDAADCGNPVREMANDALFSAGAMDMFAGLVTEMKGHSVPMKEGMLNFSVREPLGVVGKITPYNHPLMFAAMRAAAPLAAGNTVVIKPADQAPLSALRFAELIDDILPPGVINVVPGKAEAGAALASHPEISKIALIGSVPTGRAVMKAAAETVKPVMLELGGKNALVAFPDADIEETAQAVVGGMNFVWCGQSCGSTSRAFLHSDIHDAVVARVKEICYKIRPGIPTDMKTDMGAIVSKAQFDKIMSYIEIAKSEGAELLVGGKVPEEPELANGLFIEPTVFTGVSPQMRVASEEIFGPVLSILKWSDENQMVQDVNSVEYGLTASIWTNDLHAAHRTAANLEVGYVWVNSTSNHFLGASFGGYKQSGIGREESLEELLAYTQEKNINITLKEAAS